MKKQLLLPVLLMASLSASLVSCKKDDNSSKSRKDMVVGTWTVKAGGIDSNGNNMLEPAEYDTTFNDLVIKLTYNADGTAKQDITLGGLPFVSQAATWSLLDNEQTLQVITPASATSGADTINEVIQTLTQNQFDVYEKGSTPRSYVLMTR